MEMVLGVLLGLLIKGGPSQKLKFAGWITVGFLVYSMIAANSRGGLISLGALGVFAVVLHAITRSEFPAGGRSRSLFGGRPLVKRILVTIGLCSLVLAVVIVMIAFVGGDRTVTRIEQLKDEVADVDKSRTNRRLIWTSTLELIKESPVIGTGFGAYSTAITKFDISGGSFRLQQAHNDYLELLASGGIFGASLFILFSILLAVRTFRNLKSQHPLIRSASFG
jgi:O-antigen ligase